MRGIYVVACQKQEYVGNSSALSQLFVHPTSKEGVSARGLLSSLSCDELSQRAAIILLSTDEGGGVY